MAVEHEFNKIKKTARLLEKWVRFPPGLRKYASCEICCVLSRTGSLRRYDHSYWGVLKSVVCLIVITKSTWKEALSH